MGKVIPILPELTELNAARILQNIANATCTPDAKTLAILNEIDYVSYCFQRGLMTASQLVRLGLPNCEYHEARYIEERLEAATGGSDE